MDEGAEFHFFGACKAETDLLEVSESSQSTCVSIRNILEVLAVVSMVKLIEKCSFPNRHFNCFQSFNATSVQSSFNSYLRQCVGWPRGLSSLHVIRRRSGSATLALLIGLTMGIAGNEMLAFMGEG